MLCNKKINPVVTELFIRDRKLNISLFFITQSYFAVAKNIHTFLHTRELQQIVFHLSSYIEFRDFTNFYKKCAAKPYYFLVIDATLTSDNPLRFRKKLLERF